VQRVFDHLLVTGVSHDQLKRVYAPMGLDIKADAPTEIAVSVIAEILGVLRKCSAHHCGCSLAAIRANSGSIDALMNYRR
jgi:xanthine dehydrogenase accessory factor